jgi:DNA-directed RNA polymerase sigma subunit (sigma70/sigma32)
MRRNLDDIPNSTLINAIDEWEKSERNRTILKRRFIDGLTFDELSEEFNLSPQAVKKIVYKNGDRILLKLI